MDPNVRLCLELGGVVSPEDTNWDFYATYSIIDRGSVDAPGSTLPILDGGFDQRQWILGVQHRFQLARSKPSPATSPTGLDDG